MKKLVAIALFIFWAVVVAILIAGLLFYQERNSGTNNPLSGESIGGQAVSRATGSAIFLSAEEVARHNQAGDCWLIISGKVYDVSGYLNAHPGGDRTIRQSCGQDSTAQYQTRGGGKGNHSGYAYGLLNDYLVGNLGEQKTAAQIEQAQQQGRDASRQLPAQGEEEFEFEDD